MSDIVITFGINAPPIKMQLCALGIIGIEDFFIKVFQADANAINRLTVSGLLPEDEAEKCRELLYKKIVNLVKKQ